MPVTTFLQVIFSEWRIRPPSYFHSVFKSDISDHQSQVGVNRIRKKEISCKCSEGHHYYIRNNNVATPIYITASECTFTTHSLFSQKLAPPGLPQGWRSLHWECATLCSLETVRKQKVNPFHAEATFVHGRKCKKFWKSFKPCHVGIHWKALAEYYQMSTHMPWFKSFSAFLHQFVLTKSVSSSQRARHYSFLHLFPVLTVSISWLKYFVILSQVQD